MSNMGGQKVAESKEMGRGMQTGLIVGSIALVGAILGAVLYEPNLDGMSSYDKCSYRSHYKNRGGSAEACRSAVTDDAVRYLMSR